MASASFRKELVVSAQAPVGKKDLKTLRKDVANAFPRLSLEQLDAVLPLTGEWNSLKLKTSGTVLYQLAGKPPAFFDLEGRGDLYPSLFTLWALPEMLDTLETHAPVSRPLLKGADLMLPGVVVPEGGLPPFAAGAKLAVRVTGNASPVAVGVAALSAADALSGGMKGKAMLVTHVFRDALWSFGGRSTPNAGFKAEEVEACEGAPTQVDVGGVTVAAVPASSGGGGAAAALLDDETEIDSVPSAAAVAAGGAEGGGVGGGGGGGGGDATGGGSALSEAAVIERLSALSMDELLLEAFLNAASTSLRDGKGLPIDSAELYAKHMQQAKPAAIQLDAKRSSYKQVAKFFKAQHKAKLISTKEHKGEIKVLAIDHKHALLAAHTPSWPLPAGSAASAAGASAAAGAAGGGGGGGELDAEMAALSRSSAPRTCELLGPTSYTAKLFAEAGYGKSALLSREEAFDKVLFAYIDKHSLERAQGAAGAGGGAERTAARAAAAETEAGADDWEAEAEAAADAADSAPPAAGARAADEGESEGEEGEVRLDELLIECLWKVAGGKKKGDEYPTSASMQECENRFLARLQLWHRVEVDGFEPRERKGALPPIIISMGRAAGHNKTSVSGLETYHVDPDELARYGKRLFNCTTSVAELPGKYVREKEVTLQGHCVSEMVEHLQSVYKLPRKAIEVRR
ncbi:hypothetical protein KFE25_014402 [Diacronema lutheri]|uniref:SUI1 domain-containing protein n=2 Tax=Diacronema lutheri TaxID=2081491 RepID=A0A8J5X9H5_DIALT|nr:hypothetical protein KFE25_014402 [Diacronema lutheri]